MKILIIAVILTFSTCNLYSQNKIVKGRIISDQLEIVYGVLIIINDSIEVGKSDSNGFFQINIPDSIKKILFMYVGMEPTNIELLDKFDEVEVVLILSSSYDFITLKKVDKLRLKSFKKLPELHKQAFEKGIFKTDKACYIQQFRPYHRK